MRIQHNIMAMNAYRNFGNNTSKLSKNLEKLSSGYKINRAGDDAAGLAISEKMRAQITGLNQAQDNAKSGINLIQTAEGALQEVHDMLNRMVKLADQSANGTYDDDVDRAQLQKEVAQLTDEIDRIADSSNFNGIKLLDGSLGVSTTSSVTDDADKKTITTIDFSKLKDDISAGNSITIGDQTFEFVKDGDTATIDGATAITIGDTMGDTLTNLATEIANSGGGSIGSGVVEATISGEKVILVSDVSGAKPYSAPEVKANMGLTLQIGDTSDNFNKLTVSINDMHAEALGLDAISIEKQPDAATAVDAIKAAINQVSDMRGTLGATQNRLDHTINNLSVMEENIQDAESTIRDTDVAEEMMAYTKNNILIQSAQAMLAQANQVPQGVLQLLQ